MSRNKYPEQTQEKIVDVSIKLFLQKGYEQTTIQDILDALHLSKGGLYHHFKSKEEIMEAVKQKRAKYAADMLRDLMKTIQAANAKEKMKTILHRFFASTQTQAFDTVLMSQVNNPHFVMGAMQNTVNQDAPIIATLIEEGVKDGSLQTSQPLLCAEVFLLLLNYWTSSILFQRNWEETQKRLVYLQSLLRLLGLDILDDDFIESVSVGYANTEMPDGGSICEQTDAASCMTQNTAKT